MYTLYWSHNSASAAAHYCLEEAGAKYEAVLVDIGLAMGPVIASIHEKRSQMRMEIMEQGELAEEPSLGRRRLRDAMPNSASER